MSLQDHQPPLLALRAPGGARSARPGSRRADRPAVARKLAIGISVDL